MRVCCRTNLYELFSSLDPAIRRHIGKRSRPSFFVCKLLHSIHTIKAFESTNHNDNATTLYLLPFGKFLCCA